MAKYKDTQGNVIEVGNPDLNPSLVAGKTLVSDSTALGASPISVAGLQTPQTPINVPTPPAPDNGATTAMAGGNAQVASNQTYMTPNGTTVDKDGKIITAAPTNTSSIYDRLLASMNAPKPNTNSASAYDSAYNTAITPLQAGVNTADAGYNTAKSELDTINAELAGLTAESQAISTYDPAKDPANAGRGITEAGFAPQYAIRGEQLRQVALKALPLQAQAIAAQAKVAAAQGNQRLAESLLIQAQNHLDKSFSLQLKDSENDYNYRKDLYNSILKNATDAETKEINAKKDVLSKNQTDKNDALNFAQSLSSSIFKDNPALASKFAMLTPPDVNSKTFAEDLQKYNEKVAALQAQYVPKVKAEGAESVKPLNVLDIARYNELYPEAGVTAGDTEAQANAKVSASNTPEAKLRTTIVGFYSNGEPYDKVVKDITDSKSITDKATALAIAKEVYGEGDATVATPIYGTGNFKGVSLDEELAKEVDFNIKNNLPKYTGVTQSLTKKGYPLQAIDTRLHPVQSAIGSIFKSLFGN